MLVEFSIIPVGGDARTSGLLAEALKLVSESGLPYQLTPTGTCVEGGWEDVMAVVRRCHERVRRDVSHVVTTIKVEDDAGETGKLARNVTSVEEKAGVSREAIPPHGSAPDPAAREDNQQQQEPR